MTEPITGGCQCGHVRYAINGAIFSAHICHCRMCQKAFGNYFAALVGVAKTEINWTRGEPRYFRSSVAVKRGFCSDCGTPLTFSYDNAAHMNISIGSLDRPELAKLENQFGVEARQAAFGAMHTLPPSRTEDDLSADDLRNLKSLQHPDHD
jgi:hypothetical protein